MDRLNSLKTYISDVMLSEADSCYEGLLNAVRNIVIEAEESGLAEKEQEEALKYTAGIIADTLTGEEPSLPEGNRYFKDKLSLGTEYEVYPSKEVRDCLAGDDTAFHRHPDGTLIDTCGMFFDTQEDLLDEDGRPYGGDLAKVSVWGDNILASDQWDTHYEEVSLSGYVLAERADTDDCLKGLYINPETLDMLIWECSIWQGTVEVLYQPHYERV